jgi:hypothetical protein
VFTTSNSLSVIVSESANGTRGFQEWVVAYHGKEIRPRKRPNYYPHEDWISWYVRELFQGRVGIRIVISRSWESRNVGVSISLLFCKRFGEQITVRTRRAA